MSNDNKTLPLILIFGFGGLAFGGYKMYQKRKEKKEAEATAKQTQVTTTPVNTATSTTTASTTKQTWVKESWPLKKGMYGDNIKKMQAAIGTKADSYFGPNTEAALIAKGYATTVTQALFAQITGQSVAATTAQKAKQTAKSVVSTGLSKLASFFS